MLEAVLTKKFLLLSATLMGMSSYAYYLLFFNEPTKGSEPSESGSQLVADLEDLEVEQSQIVSDAENNEKMDGETSLPEFTEYELHDIEVRLEKLKNRLEKIKQS